MSLRLQPVPQVPEETARVARAALPHGNIYIKMRDEWGTIFTDEDFIVLFSSLGQSAIAPWQLALVTIMQYVENLSDRQAADALRSRAERGVTVVHTAVLRWVQRFVPAFEKLWKKYARPVDSSWRVDETYIKVKGQWRYLYRAVDKQGQTVDFLLTKNRD